MAAHENVIVRYLNWIYMGIGIARDVLIERICGLLCGRNEITPARVTFRLVLVVIVLSVVSVVVGVLTPGLRMGWSFGEGDLMTWFSFGLLLFVALVSGEIWRVHDGDPKSGRMWQLLSYGFVFLALDELFRIHESTDRLIHRILGIQETNLTDHLDDAIILLYGLIALAILVRYWRESMKFLNVWPYFLCAVLLACSTEVFDFLAGAKPFWIAVLKDRAMALMLVDILDVVEETLKILSEVFFVGAFLGVYWPLRGVDAQQTLCSRSAC